MSNDLLFLAMMKQHPEWQNHSERTMNPEDSIEDPVVMDLMIHSPKSTLPLHNYYSEFRLGQGDPLLKAAMKQWPYTTVNEDEEERPPFYTASRALSILPCKTLSDPSAGHMYWSTNDILHMDDVGHVESKQCGASSSERRYVLMSEDRRFVLV